MKIVVGLGNPGKKYEGTRHNIGFEFLHTVAHRWSADPAKEKHQGLLSEARVSGQKVLLLAPQTYMNLSGVSVRSVVDFYKADATDVLVVCDDFNLPLGKLRIRPKGSAGGQNGLANIIEHLGTDAFPRLRLGIGPVPAEWNVVDFVLGKFSRQEQVEVDNVLTRAAAAAECWIAEGVDATMNGFN